MYKEEEVKLTSTGGGVDDQVEKGRDSAEARVQEESLVSRTEDCVVVPAPPYVPVPGTYSRMAQDSQEDPFPGNQCEE